MATRQTIHGYPVLHQYPTPARGANVAGAFLLITVAKDERDEPYVVAWAREGSEYWTEGAQYDNYAVAQADFQGRVEREQRLQAAFGTPATINPSVVDFAADLAMTCDARELAEAFLALTRPGPDAATLPEGDARGLRDDEQRLAVRSALYAKLAREGTVMLPGGR